VLYRRALQGFLEAGKSTVSSAELAEAADCTAEMVRRDLMEIPCSGSPRRGYPAPELLAGIDVVMGSARNMPVALVGLGNLGRAVLGYLSGRDCPLQLRAVFDRDPEVVGRNFCGLPCCHVDSLADTVRDLSIRLGIITVPADQAQAVADLMVASGINGILNFAPTILAVPEGVALENMDILVALEAVAWMSRLAAISRQDGAAR
jgi:redox-sensing transcriptional repressor